MVIGESRCRLSALSRPAITTASVRATVAIRIKKLDLFSASLPATSHGVIIVALGILSRDRDDANLAWRRGT
jgi:hypothetical protein